MVRTVVILVVLYRATPDSLSFHICKDSTLTRKSFHSKTPHHHIPNLSTYTLLPVTSNFPAPLSNLETGSVITRQFHIAFYLPRCVPVFCTVSMSGVACVLCFPPKHYIAKKHSFPPLNRTAILVTSFSPSTLIILDIYLCRNYS